MRSAVDFLNTGQIPAMDQPPYAIGKAIQRKWPESYGQQSYVLMLGGLYTEMALWKCMGDLLLSSGWTDMLIVSDVTTFGVAESFLTCSHDKRTRHAHELTVMVLNKLQEDAYEKKFSAMNRDEWRQSMCTTSPTFCTGIWYCDMKFLYSYSFGPIVNRTSSYTDKFYWSCLDHQNYARWELLRSSKLCAMAVGTYS